MGVFQSKTIEQCMEEMEDRCFFEFRGEIWNPRPLDGESEADRFPLCNLPNIGSLLKSYCDAKEVYDLMVSELVLARPIETFYYGLFSLYHHVGDKMQFVLICRWLMSEVKDPNHKLKRIMLAPINDDLVPFVRMMYDRCKTEMELRQTMEMLYRLFVNDYDTLMNALFNEEYRSPNVLIFHWIGPRRSLVHD